MRKVFIDNLKGNEVLAKPIYTSTDMILLSQGVRIKKSYIEKLKELGIEYLYIEDEMSQGIEIVDFINERTREECKKEVRNVLEKFSTSGRIEMDGIAKVAQQVINDILQSEEVIVNISDIRRDDEYVYSHCVNVCSLSVLTAIKRGYSMDKAKELAIGALLHDLGMALIPEDILKSYDTLNDAEKELYKQHVIYGYDAVKDEMWLSGIAKVIILTHHERIDGSGYPFGWKGDRLHDAAKIVAICDTFDTMTNNRDVKASLKIYEVIEYLTAMKDILFDGDIVNTFVSYIAVYPSGSGVITNLGQKAIVVRQNKNLPARPVIRLLGDDDPSKTDALSEINLEKERTVFIIDTFEL
jgi:HD-GYP domain-containing protein (c-di-GMP phosphodiesterase class II)